MKSSFNLIAEDKSIYTFNWCDAVDVIHPDRGRGLATAECLRDTTQPFILCNTQPAYDCPDIPRTQIKIVTVQTIMNHDLAHYNSLT